MYCVYDLFKNCSTFPVMQLRDLFVLVFVINIQAVLHRDTVPEVFLGISLLRTILYAVIPFNRIGIFTCIELILLMQLLQLY